MKTTTVMASAPPHESDETENLASSTSPITTLHPDIIHTHILTRLDGATLTAASCVSSELRHLCTGDDLWRNVCTATWPSLLDPIASHVISTFPGGHRSFFSDAFPSLHDSPSHANHHPHPPSPEWISAVDIYCQGKPLFSMVKRNRIRDYNYICLTLEVDNVLVPTPVTDEEGVKKYMQENFSLSWILIDPTRKRAANLSGWKPILVKCWCNGSRVEVVYSVFDSTNLVAVEEGMIAGQQQQGPAEMVQCVVTVMCSVEVGGELHVSRVNMVISDMDGWPLECREGVMILQRAIENGERKKVNEVRAKERFDNFLCKKKERKACYKALFAAQGNIRGFAGWFRRMKVYGEVPEYTHENTDLYSQRSRFP